MDQRFFADRHTDLAVLVVALDQFAGEDIGMGIQRKMSIALQQVPETAGMVVVAMGQQQKFDRNMGGQASVDVGFQSIMGLAGAGIDQHRRRAAAQPPGGDETILLVEDAAPVRRLVQRTLEKESMLLVLDHVAGVLAERDVEDMLEGRSVPTPELAHDVEIGRGMPRSVVGSIRLPDRELELYRRWIADGAHP